MSIDLLFVLCPLELLIFLLFLSIFPVNKKHAFSFFIVLTFFLCFSCAIFFYSFLLPRLSFSLIYWYYYLTQLHFRSTVLWILLYFKILLLIFFFFAHLQRVILKLQQIFIFSKPINFLITLTSTLLTSAQKAQKFFPIHFKDYFS